MPPRKSTRKALQSNKKKKKTPSEKAEALLKTYERLNALAEEMKKSTTEEGKPKLWKMSRKDVELTLMLTCVPCWDALIPPDPSADVLVIHNPLKLPFGEQFRKHYPELENMLGTVQKVFTVNK